MFSASTSLIEIYSAWSYNILRDNYLQDIIFIAFSFDLFHVQLPVHRYKLTVERGI